MCDDSEPLDTAWRTASHRSPLSEIAWVLGMPVSSFFAAAPDEAAPISESPPGATVLLDLVQAYLLRAPPEARRHFVARVQAMAESPPGRAPRIAD